MNPYVGPDFIHSYHLQNGPDILFQVLTKFLNACILHGYLPDGITRAAINPLIKDKLGYVHDANNYRPIFSSSVFLKLLEYCILQKITCFFKI